MAGKAVAAEGFSLAQFPVARRDFAVVLYSEGFRHSLYHVAWRPYFPFIQPDRERL